MLRLFLILLLGFLVFRIVRNFFKGYSGSFGKEFKNKKSNKGIDYKNIEEAHYTEIKDEDKSK